MLEFDTICGKGKNHTGNIDMKTLMKTAMKTIMKTGYAVDATYTTSCAPLPMMEDLGLGSVAIARPASL